MNSTLRLFLGALTVALLFGCTTGSVIVVDSSRAPLDPADVRIYLIPPAEYSLLGVVEASSEVAFSSQAAQDRMLTELKEQAASIGANGVLLVSSDTRTTGYSGFLDDDFFLIDAEQAKVATAEAIYVYRQ